MTSTTSFSLEGRGLKLNTAADVQAHIEPLLAPSAANAITTLSLSGNTIGVEAAEALAPHLSKLTSLQTADLSDIFTSRLLSEIPPALEALLTALLPLKKLHTVNLSDNAFGLNTQAPLVRFLEKHTPLRHLILNNNGLGPEAGTLVADALTRLAEAKRKEGAESAFLETIVCGRNRLESGSSKAWARALAAHASSLREIRMTQNGIRVEGTRTLLRDGLRNAKGLQVLDLQDNLFTVPGAQALVEVLGGWTQLKELAVQDTLWRARGGVLLAENLAKGQNKALEVLRLQYNEIDAKGIKGLVAAVEKGALPKLRRVELNGNRFAEDDPAIERLQEILDERREEAGAEEDDEQWGLDELDELDDDEEEEDDDGDAPADEDDDVDGKAEKELQLADEAEGENVAEEKDDDVDALAEKLGKTEI